jgi:hypothetical protein
MFSLFEPYGLRYHAELKKELSNHEQDSLESLFSVTYVDPSLEDVFIRIVEGANR